MTTRRKLLWTLVGLTAVLACNDHGLIPLDQAIEVVKIQVVEVQPSDQIDILWVIDNSNSMCVEQEALTANFETFIEGLAAIDADFNMAVVTTDMSDGGGRGRFVDRPGTISDPDCSDVQPPVCERRADPVLHYEDYANADGSFDVDALQEDFRCIASVGTVVSGGAGIERGLDAMAAALSPDLLDTANAGFRRPGAWLAIFFLTDENDCSHGGSMDPLPDECEYLRDDLIPVEAFVNQIASLEGTQNGEQVLVAGIIGPDNGLRPVSPQQLQPSCSGPKGNAMAGYRYEEFINAFGDRGVQADICNDSFRVALDQIASVIQANLGIDCLEGNLPTCEDDFDCASGVGCRAPSEVDAVQVCDNVTFGVEVTRADGTVEEFVESTPDTPGDFEVDYTAGVCASGIGIRFVGERPPFPGDTYELRYPTLIDLDADEDPNDGSGSGSN